MISLPFIDHEIFGGLHSSLAEVTKLCLQQFHLITHFILISPLGTRFPNPAPLNPSKPRQWRFPHNHDDNISERSPILQADHQLFKIKTLHLTSVRRLPSHVITCLVSFLPYIESLTIAKCNAVESLDFKDGSKLREVKVLDCPRLESFSFQGSHLSAFKIKTLHLISLNRLSSSVITWLVLSLPFLESLTIAKCNGVECLDLKDGDNLREVIVLDCPRLEYLSLQGSHLYAFRYRGELVYFRFKLTYMCRDVMLDFRQGPQTEWTIWETENPFLNLPDHNKTNNCGCDNKFECFKSILESIEIVESLTLCRWFFERTICKKLASSSGKPGFCFGSLKDLWWIDCSMERENINALLCFLKLCPNLERLYVTIDPKCYNLPSTEKFSAIMGGPDKLSRLKFVKLEGFKDEIKEFFLARRLVPLFVGSPVIVSKPDDRACFRQLVKVCRLEKKGKYPYKFKVVEDLHENFPDHPHMHL